MINRKNRNKNRVRNYNAFLIIVYYYLYLIFKVYILYGESRVVRKYENSNKYVAKKK